MIKTLFDPSKDFYRTIEKVTARVLHEHGYDGPLDLEVIGAGDYPLEQCCIIAAEARGHMQACLQACGAR